MRIKHDKKSFFHRSFRRGFFFAWWKYNICLDLRQLWSRTSSKLLLKSQAQNEKKKNCTLEIFKARTKEMCIIAPMWCFTIALKICLHRKQTKATFILYAMRIVRVEFLPTYQKLLLTWVIPHHWRKLCSYHLRCHFSKETGDKN